LKLEAGARCALPPSLQFDSGFSTLFEMLRPPTKILIALLLVSVAAAWTNGQPQQTSTPSTRTVTARSGDTIARIAHRVGIPAADIARLNGLSEKARLPRGMKIYLPAESTPPKSQSGEVVGNTITLADGYSFVADEVWKQGDEIWYRQGNVTKSLDETVKSVRPIYKELKAAPASDTAATPPDAEKKPAKLAFWIHLQDGARFRVDEVEETTDGAWYSRNNLSIFVARERIASIEREMPAPAGGNRQARDWTSGNPTIDQLIRTNGSRFGIDPYLVFLVIEQESHFHVRAVSPKGARGLMQLMPGTARRYGVSRPFDAAENIRAGTQYLRELMDMFGGQVNLVLASYNAGEGAVIKYGRNVPPYRETRDYVKTIGKRYGMAGRRPTADNELPTPQR
jgi:soluble lytic murein transglycosylase-like protein